MIEFVLELFGHFFWISPHTVAFIDKSDSGYFITVHLSVHSDRLGLDTTYRAQNKNCSIQNTEGAFQPFFGGHVDLIYTECDCGQDESEDTRIGMSAVVGGEYFVTRRVSLEGEVGAGIYFGSFGLETSTRLAAFMYL